MKMVEKVAGWIVRDGSISDIQNLTVSALGEDKRSA